MAIVVLKPGETATSDEIRTHLRDFASRGLMSHYAIPEQVKFVEQLPKTSVGKLNKRSLRATYIV